MRISVALCTYNGSKYLKEQLDSIASQSLLPDELVICDDGSLDATESIVRAFEKTALFKVVFLRNEKNLGSTLNFEKAISCCSGDLIALCDQDDLWLPLKLEKLTAAIEADARIGGAFSDALLIDGSGRDLASTLWSQVQYIPDRNSTDLDRKTLLRHNVVTGATMMFRSSLRPMLMPIPRQWVHDGWLAWMLVLKARLV